MNAGRDVERLIAGWLLEEAADRAPDRVLDAARRSIDRTRQRRFVAAWREPVYVSPIKFAAAAAVVAIAVIGGAFFGRMTAPSGVGSPGTAPSTAPAATGDAAAALVAYRAARDEICTRYTTEANPMKRAAEGIYDPNTTPAGRATKIEALERFVALYGDLIGELRAIDPPPAVATDHIAHVARFEDLRDMIDQIVVVLKEGDLEGAERIDLATEPIAANIEAFEREYVVARCP
jgi:hypothetical protein